MLYHRIGFHFHSYGKHGHHFILLAFWEDLFSGTTGDHVGRPFWETNGLLPSWAQNLRERGRRIHLISGAAAAGGQRLRRRLGRRTPGDAAPTQALRGGGGGCGFPAACNILASTCRKTAEESKQTRGHKTSCSKVMFRASGPPLSLVKRF